MESKIIPGRVLHKRTVSSVTQLCLTLCDPMDWLPCPSPTSKAYSNSCPLSQWCHLTISSSVFPFSSCLQSFPVSGSFLMKILSTLYSWYVIIWHSKNSFFPPLMNMLFLLIYSCRSFVFLYRSFIVQLVKNPPVMQETPVRFLGQEDPLEKGKATHSNIMAWRIPWTV